MKKLIVFIITVIASTLAGQWIDPHDMNTNAKEKYMKSTLKKSSSSSLMNDQIIDLSSKLCNSHLRRVISVLISSAHIDKRDPKDYNGHIRFHINPSDLDFLMAFSKEDLSLEKLRKLDKILSDSFQQTYINEYLDTIESFQLKLYSVVMNMQNLWLLGIIYLFYVLYQLFKNEFSFFYILKYLLIIVLVIDLGYRYHYLLEEAEEHNLNVAYSKNCDPSKMSWGEWTKFVFSSKNCEKKTVTPLDAMLYQVKHIIIVPMQAFGTGMGNFGQNMFTSLPWGLNLVMWPIMLIFTLIFVLFLLTLCSGKTIEFNIFHLVKLKFGGGGQENSLPMPTFERLMDKILGRPVVQNVHVALPANSTELSPINELSEPSNNSPRLESKVEGQITCCEKGTNTCYIKSGENFIEDIIDLSIDESGNTSRCTEKVSICEELKDVKDCLLVSDGITKSSEYSYVSNESIGDELTRVKGCYSDEIGQPSNCIILKEETNEEHKSIKGSLLNTHGDGDKPNKLVTKKLQDNIKDEQT